MRTNESVAKETAISNRFQRNMDGTRFKNDRPDWLREEAKNAGRPPVSPQRVGEWRLEWQPDEEMLSTLSSQGVKGSYGRVETDIGEITKERKIPGVGVRHLGASLLMNPLLTPRRPVWNTVKGLISTEIMPLDIQPSVIRIGERLHGSRAAAGANPASRPATAAARHADILRPESGGRIWRGGGGIQPSRPLTAGSFRAAGMPVHHKPLSAAESRPASAAMQNSDAMTLQAVHRRITSLQRPGSAASAAGRGFVAEGDAGALSGDGSKAGINKTREDRGGDRRGRGDRASRGSIRSSATGDGPFSSPIGVATTDISAPSGPCVGIHL